MALLLADENFPMPAIETLRQLGHDVQTLQELGKAGLAVPDEEVLQLATSLGRCLMTLNRTDFIKLYALDTAHADILICKVDPDFNALAHRIHNSLTDKEVSTVGQLIRVQSTAQ